ncbi:MAG: MerR family transcriptional regulator [Oscillospiraceae bacterium]|jgi:DNA-binding transcriptional MerR regulator|nr:MerR family transcriptional regulator [Oscillospiraceae bacterium]
MNAAIPIHRLSSQIGLSSRTLRHWESEGLFDSMRDKDSGWRIYDEKAVFRIRITAMLRQLDIPIKEIKTVLDNQSVVFLHRVIERQISVLGEYNEENKEKEQRLLQFLSLLRKQESTVKLDAELPQLLLKMEDINMSNMQNSNNSLRYVTLPPMRFGCYVSVGLSPEDDATSPVFDWIDSANLGGTARFFGGNMPPMPGGEGKPYGYGMAASIPEGIAIPKHLKEMRSPGGLYAMLESTDDIPGSWKRLLKLIKEDGKYVSDRARLCFEEHVRNDSGGFLIVLLEPVKSNREN